MHYFVRFSLAAVGAAAISACTSIQVQRAEDDAGSLPDGLVYYLPAKQFSITVPFEVENCLVDADKAPAITYSMAPVVTETLVGDVSQVHVIRYSALAGKTKVTGFNIELFDNGTLKSVNAHAEDRTGQIITSTVQALGNVARGVALGKFYAAEVAEVTQEKLCSKQLIYLLAERDGAKQRLENEKDKDKGRRAKSAAVSEAVDALAEARVNARDAEKTGTAKDKAEAKKAVAVAEERLNVVKAELEALGQSKADKNAADLAAARTALTQKVTLVWQPKPGDLQVQIRYPDQAWDKLLTDDGKKALQAKLGGADIRPASLNRLFALVKLSVAGMGDRSVGAKPAATNTAQGIVYRQPVSAQMTICAGDGCDSGAGIANAVLNQTFLIPQLGALGSLPLKNEVFEKNSLVLAQLADGTMVSLRFDADAALEKAAETAKQASETYMTTVSNLIQDRRTELNAQRDDRKKDREESKDERAERKDIREEGAAVRADANASLKETAERITLMRDVEARRNGDMDKVQREIDRNAREKQLIDSQIELLKKRKELAKELEQ